MAGMFSDSHLTMRRMGNKAPMLWELRQSESDHCIPERLLTDYLMSTRRDHQVLFAVYRIGHRGSVSGCRQRRTPNFFPSLDIECPDMRVGGACYENKGAFRGDWTAEADRSRGYGTVR